MTKTEEMNLEPSQASEWQTNEELPRVLMSNDPRAERFNPPPPVPCEYCGQPRYTKGIRSGNTYTWALSGGPRRCECDGALEARRREIEAREMWEKINSIIGGNGMGARFRRRTFDTFIKTDENQRPLRICKAYADTFSNKLPQNNPEPGRNGLFITGPMGTGKTHLVAAIANQLIDEGTPVICMTMIDLLARIRQTYERSQRPGAKYNEDEILNIYKEVPLLIIDDMGKEQTTTWIVSKIYEIINARYEAYMPTIITTNYSDSELVHRFTPKETGDPTTAAATIDRLREMCAAIVTTGDSWRSK